MLINKISVNYVVINIKELESRTGFDPELFLKI